MADQPYNELGQILSAGGEIALGVHIALGRSPSAMILLFRRRFDPIRSADRAELMSLATRGAALQFPADRNTWDAIMPLSDIPINSYLFGGGTDGRRILTVADWSVDDGETWRQNRIEWSDAPTWSELAEELARMAYEALGSSPAKFPSQEAGYRPEVKYRILFGERAF